MPDPVTLTIDGRTIKAEPGTLVIDAAKQNGIEVPSFCYYPGLSLQAACRMCIVEIEKFPKLQTACTVPVAEGMVVRTESEKVKAARKSTLEFLLTNHPLDCPVCDKGGECELQDMVFRYGAGISRFREEKLHVDEKQWSPVVYFDAPRCILCYRCVRICGEGMDVGALGIVNRGAHSEIAPNRGDHLECEECGACIDICPVGALTSGSYRHKARPWEIKYVPTICTHCGDGCKTTLSVRNNNILRGNNRDMSGVNREFLCIKGRYGYDFINHPARLKQPMMRKEGQHVPVSWAEALNAIGLKLQEARTRGQQIGVVGSGKITNEAAYYLQKFARAGLGTNNVDHRRSADYPALMNALSGRSTADGASPLAASIDALYAPAILLIGNNPTDQHPLLAYNIRANVRLRRARVYIVNRAEIQLKRQAAAYLKINRGDEAATLDFLSGVSSSLPGYAESDAWKSFRDQLRKEKELLVIFGSEIKGDDVARVVALGDSLEGKTRYIALSDYNNSRGAADMGLYPDLLPGYTPLAAAGALDRFQQAWNVNGLPAQPGLDLDEMMAAAARGQLAALYVVGANPVKRYPLQAGQTFLVVQDMFHTETAQQADFVLPAASGYENTGTFTNTCGEVQRVLKAMLVNGPKPDLEIFGLLAKEMGIDVGPPHVERVFEEIRRTVKGYDVSTAALLLGQAQSAAPLNGTVIYRGRGELIYSSNDTLFTSGTLGRYSMSLNSVHEREFRKNPEGIGD